MPNKPFSSKVAPLQYSQQDNYLFKKIIQIAAKVKADFSQIENNSDVIIELALLHFWLHYLLQHKDPSSYYFLAVQNFQNYLKINFSKIVIPKLHGFYQEFVDNEAYILKLINKFEKDFIKKKVEELAPAYMRIQTKTSLTDALLSLVQSAMPREIDLSDFKQNDMNIKPRLQRHYEELNISPSVTPCFYADMCLTMVGIMDLQGRDPTLIKERKEYLQTVIESDLMDIKKLEHVKFMRLADIIDKFIREVKFYETVLSNKNISQAGFIGVNAIQRSKKIMETPESICSAERKMQFLKQVINILGGIQVEFNSEITQLYRSLYPTFDPEKIYAELGWNVTIEWPEPVDSVETNSSCSTTYKETDADSDKENLPSTVIFHDLEYTVPNPIKALAARPKALLSLRI